MKKLFYLSKKNIRSYGRKISYSAAYIISIILTVDRKNCYSMSRETCFSSKKLYAFFKEASNNSKDIRKHLIDKANSLYKTKEISSLVVDASMLMKRFSRKIEGVTYDRNGVTSRIERGISFVSIAWTNGKVTIPLDFDFWFNKKSVSSDKYREKSLIARDLILSLKDKLMFSLAILDGGFASITMINFFKNNDLNYLMRIPKNRKVISECGKFEQLQKHPALKLKRNQRYKTIKALYKGIACFITAHKRTNKNGGKQIVYLVSNVDVPPKKQAELYKIRWVIEKSYRTLKQKLGISDCQATGLEKQRAHILATFFAYANLEEQKLFKKKKSPEEILNRIRMQKTLHQFIELNLLEETIMF